MTVPDSAQVMRSFTRAFKVPVLIGKIQGWHIPGGPFTVPQVLLAVGAYVTAMWLRPTWGRWGVLDYLAAALLAAPVGYFAGKLRTGARDPLTAGWALLSVLSGPTHGRYRGRPLRHRTRLPWRLGPARLATGCPGGPPALVAPAPQTQPSAAPAEPDPDEIQLAAAPEAPATPDLEPPPVPRTALAALLARRGQDRPEAA